VNSRLCYAEVDDLYGAGVTDNDILRAYVAMNDSERSSGVVFFIMHVVESGGDFGYEIAGVFYWDELARFYATFVDLGERFAVNEFHDHEIVVADLPKVVNLSDVAVR